jgi:DNA-binding CsgD family transcriptional regulator
MSVTARDLNRILDAVSAMNDADDGTFERTMLTSAAELVACDTVSYNEHHLDRGEEIRCLAEPSYVERSPARRDYLRHLGHHPPVAACATGRLVTGDTASVSDLLTQREYRRLPIYGDYFRQRGVEDQLVAVVKARDARTVLVVFSRSRRGFADRDRTVVSLLMPHLQNAVRHRHRLAALTTSVAGRPAPLGPDLWAALTERERDIVTCLATGSTDQRIARTLAISPRTVGKHLENVYRKVNVSGRVELVATLAASPLAALSAAA